MTDLSKSLDETFWLLWGKTQRGDSTGSPMPDYHPLICHIVDVWAVARVLLLNRLSPALVARLRRPLGIADSHAACAWLAFFVAMHDLGKVSPAFQSQWEPGAAALKHAGLPFPRRRAQKVYHDRVTAVVLPSLLKEQLKVPHGVAQAVARAVGAHHGTFPTDMACLRVQRAREAIGGGEWGRQRGLILEAMVTIGSLDQLPVPEPSLGSDWAAVALLTGLTTLADWLGSREEIFTFSEPGVDLGEYTRKAKERAEESVDSAGFQLRSPRCESRSFVDLFGFDPRPLQSAVATGGVSAHPSFVVIEAPTGEGKTEAAFYLAHRFAAELGQDGMFVGLPTQATSNQMFGRVKAYLSRGNSGGNLQLAHGAAALNPDYRELRLRGVYGQVPDSEVVASEWFASRKRTLLAQYGVGTIDQALFGVLRVRHGYLRLFGLAGKTVILDEVHAYDTYTSTLIHRLLAWLGQMGASVVLLSATLPYERLRSLIASYSGKTPPTEIAAYPRITMATQGGVRSEHVEPHGSDRRIHVQRLANDLPHVARTVLDELKDGGCAAWICNSIHRAQQAYELLVGAEPELHVDLLHSRLLQADRQDREVEAERRYGPDGAQRPKRSVLVGTQVLEQSLDLDFDLMVSDLAPVDLVVQRAGRLHRHQRGGEARPSRLRHPRLCVVWPDSNEAGAPELDAVAGVYAEDVVYATWLVLRDVDELILPNDLESLIERVYGTHAIVAEADELTHLEHLRAQEKKRRDEEEVQAKTRQWPSPTMHDDPFSNLTMPFEEDDPKVARELQALTRLGGPSVEVVFLRETERGPETVVSGALIDLDRSPDAGLTRELVLSSARISHRGLAPRLIDLPVPAGWRKHGLLRRYRCLTVRDNEVQVDRWRVALERRLGVTIGKETS